MAKIFVLVIAVIIPLLPLGVWASHTIEGFAQAGDRLAVYFYFPARAFALVGFVLMFYQFILSARMSILEHIFSRPKLVKTHRTLGKIGFTLILLHGMLMIATDFADFGALIFTWQKLIGMIAFFLLATGVVAAWFFKALDFNVKTWRKIHLLAYVAFPLVFFHAIAIGLTLRQSRPITVLFTMLFAWYLAMVAARLFGAARGVLHPATSGAQPSAKGAGRDGAGRAGTAGSGRSGSQKTAVTTTDASRQVSESPKASAPARPSGATGSQTERLDERS
jgi:DMSO/TMAO reductase YedYZ heme-binding membrane subunit